MKRVFLLIFVIVTGLIGLSLYSTYAIYVTSSNSVNMSTTLSYEFDINSQTSFSVPAGKVLHFNAVLKNPYNKSLKYAIYHSYTSNNSNVIIGEVVEDSTVTTTPSNVTGLLDAGNTKNVSLAVINNSSSTVSISFGLIPGYNNNDITYATNQKAITSTISNSSVYNYKCVNDFQFDESSCVNKIVNGSLNRYCSTKISSEEEVLQTQYRYGEEACAAYKCCTTTSTPGNIYRGCYDEEQDGMDCIRTRCTDDDGYAMIGYTCSMYQTTTTCTENQTSCESGATATCTSSYINYFDWSTTDRTGESNCQVRTCAKDFKGLYSLCDEASDC